MLTNGSSSSERSDGPPSPVDLTEGKAMKADPILFKFLDSHFLPWDTQACHRAYLAREMFPQSFPSYEAVGAQGYFCDPFQCGAVILVAHVGGRCEVVRLHLPSLSEPAAHHLHLPLVVPEVPSLFCKVHIDTMLMPTVKQFCYLCSPLCFVIWPKWHPLWKENRRPLGISYSRRYSCRRWGGFLRHATNGG